MVAYSCSSYPAYPLEEVEVRNLHKLKSDKSAHINGELMLIDNSKRANSQKILNTSWISVLIYANGHFHLLAVKKQIVTVEGKLEVVPYLFAFLCYVVTEVEVTVLKKKRRTLLIEDQNNHLN